MLTRRLMLAGSIACAAITGGCGGSSSSSLPAGFYITISGMAFSPTNLAVPPGATVTVLNRDSIAHTVTSEATSGAYTPGSVGGVSFDTGQFTGQKSFTIPSTATEGTVIPYYCKVHTSTMATPNGTITIQASAQPGPAPSTGSSGGY